MGIIRELVMIVAFTHRICFLVFFSFQSEIIFDNVCLVAGFEKRADSRLVAK